MPAPPPGCSIDHTDRETLVELRRELHRVPEPVWCGFQTTARVVEACRSIGVDGLHVNRDVVDADARMAMSEDAELSKWQDRASAAGADEEAVTVPRIARLRSRSGPETRRGGRDIP